MVSRIIHNKLWLGDIDDGKNANEYGVDFDRVITVGPEEPTEHTTDHFPMPDGGWSFDTEEHYPTFRMAVNTVRGAMMDGETTLVHCHMGVSRSAMVTTAAIATLDGTSFESAWTEVRGKRPIVNPSPELKFCATRYVTRFQQDDEGDTPQSE